MAAGCKIIMIIEIRGAHRLSFREKQVVTLKEMGASSADIAKRLNISQGSVATLYNRARNKGFETVIVISGDTLDLSDPEEENLDEE